MKAKPVQPERKEGGGVPLFDPLKCNGCGDCIEFCRQGLLAFDRSRGVPVPREGEECAPGCRTCARICTRGAATFHDEERFIAYLKKRLDRSIPLDDVVN